jgi:4-hydroxythreonine-4-phosphate dehydrogenase
MAIASEPLRTVMVTRHLPFNQVSRSLDKKTIAETIQLAADWMKQMGKTRPKIGVCALNPHAGEKGLLGKEEMEIIHPAMKMVRPRRSMILCGPLPADSAYRDHRNGIYDCLITMYHDQSLIPLKLFNSDKLVNITLGLPFPRTSPGHGTAFDIVGKKEVNPRPMIEAILTAADLAHR